MEGEEGRVGACNGGDWLSRSGETMKAERERGVSRVRVCMSRVCAERVSCVCVWCVCVQGVCVSGEEATTVVVVEVQREEGEKGGSERERGGVSEREILCSLCLSLYKKNRILCL